MACSATLSLIESSTTLANSLSSVGRARSFVRQAIRGRIDDEVVSTVELLTSEVVTNALLHAQSAAELHVMMVDDVVRVEVSDWSPRPPVQRPIDEEAASGRGMLIVEALARAWGVELRDGGKQVWFEVEC